ncbi:MAG: DUF3667 domain-containing protein [Proteobacteria bacterium]|nr:DUF3667 domain-containing protein [Pseudomonadota bacterium]
MNKRAAELPDHPNCLNCGTELRGQYCGHCGQRARSRLISLWELLQDAFGDLFELDSRLWRTLIPLLARPGRLTRDYLEGRRARYMPPFRMYLVLSVVFFVVAFFDPRDDLSLLFEPEPAPEEQTAGKDATRPEVREALDELAAEGVAGKNDEGGIDFSIDPETGECTLDDAGYEEMPEWLRKRLTRDRLEGICERISADGAKTFSGLLLDNIPIALIVLLPFMALVLKGLYPLSRRYFVEHLLFFLHFHAFFFLILTLEILFSRLASLVFVPEAIVALILVAASFYIPVYLYKAMRTVYAQGHLLTFTKYVALVIAYGVGATFTMLGALFFALLSV